MNNLLLEIIENKKNEIMPIRQYSNNEIHEIIKLRRTLHNSSFKDAIKKCEFSIIGEIKRKSPSKGELAKIDNPIQLAKKYVSGGVDAISVLTDKKYFSGSIEDLKHIRKHISVPILRKDFIIDKNQIIETVTHAADAVLLIVSVLQQKTKCLFDLAKELKIDALIEVHTRSELDYALTLGAEIIGINNRNLNTFEVDLNHSFELIQYIPNHIVSISESGIKTAEDAIKLKNAGFNAVLIGESLVKHPEPKLFIQQMKGVK
jgi:indole-3-glycerol phosphate synthase